MSGQPSDEATKRRSDTAARRGPRTRSPTRRFHPAAFLLAALAIAANVRSQTATSPATTAPAAAVPPRTIGKWLVDLGRDYPLTPQASIRNADAELTLAFMQAASRVEPALAEPYLWQHDLLWALDREDEATEALGRYVQLQKDDWSARVLWIAAKTAAFQTLEERVRFWEDQLGQPDLPGEVASDLQRRMAEYYYNRGETDAAREQVNAALKRFPENLAAQGLRIKLSADPQDPAARLAMALDTVRASPAQPLFAWDVARLLDEVSLHSEAQPWYEHALAMFQQNNPGQSAPGEFLLEMAASQIEAGLLDSAEKLVKQVIQTDGDGSSPRRLLARIAKLRNKANEAKTQLSIARSDYESTWAKMKATPDPDFAAEMAWYYCVDDPNIDRAYTLGTTAMQAAAPSDLARRAFGFAAAQKGMVAEAQKALEPIAESDPWAAVALADVKEKAGDAKAATALLTQVAERYRSGPLFEEAAARLRALNTTIPRPPTWPGVKDLLRHFDEAILLFPVDAKKFVDLTVTPLVPASGELLPGEPIWCRFVLRNRSPFNITLGENLMVSPTILILAKSSGDRERDYGGLVRVAMNRRQLLAPGQSLTVTQTIDIGPLRTTLIATPQTTQTIELAAVLNPLYLPEQGQWVARPGGFVTNPIRIERQGVSPDQSGPLGLQETLNTARNGDVTERVQALNRMMMWLAEQEHLRAGRLSYQARPVDSQVLLTAVHERFDDPAWEVRAHLAETLRWVMLNGDLARLASGMLNDSDWLVRMLAVRLFADHQKEKFEKVAAYFAQNAPDPLVQAAAAAVRARWAPATQPADTQPATTTPAEP